eukprot:gnl/MRDRNA2_/MRDRNA2_97149_c0_seq1.p1 gnl/MRDRNA2_/MRDRNA2_97149_c0~~gnl/MRDRNA2_/MRDRNA2_97149_c0_seq1.p1  ORF type:complete len:264 (-),score=46.10 gnl/MRDRNA2_/MRDRNA2_97149_c0_seq1:3-794(-)
MVQLGQIFVIFLSTVSVQALKLNPNELEFLKINPDYDKWVQVVGEYENMVTQISAIERTDAQFEPLMNTMYDIEARLYQATKPFLQVREVDASKLTEMIEKKDGWFSPKKDLFIVFFADWCPDCQMFVEHNSTSWDPTTAPLELLQKAVNAGRADKTLDIVRFNINTMTKDDQKMVAKYFDFQTELAYIPNIFMLSADGNKTQYTDDDDDWNIEKIEKWIEHYSSKTKSVQGGYSGPGGAPKSHHGPCETGHPCFFKPKTPLS